MASRTLLTFVATLALLAPLAVATAEAAAPVNPAADLKDPLYASLKVEDGAKIERIEPTGLDTVLEEHEPEEVSSKKVDAPELVPGAKPEALAIEKVDLPDNELAQATAADNLPVAEKKQEDEKIDASKPDVVRSYRYRRCKAKCRVGHGYCSRYCTYNVCYFRVKTAYRQAYIVKVRVAKRVRRPVIVYVRKCRKRYSRRYYKREYSCKIKKKYRYVKGYVYVIKYVKKYRIYYKYKYVAGHRCLYPHY